MNKRNREIEDGKSVFYYFDDDLANEFWGMFEVPSRDEIDVWVDNYNK